MKRGSIVLQKVVCVKADTNHEHKMQYVSKRLGSRMQGAVQPHARLNCCQRHDPFDSKSRVNTFFEHVST